jgi:hypothetical protein
VGTSQGLIAHIDQVIEYFNKRKLDLPDGFFDRKAQFVINGVPFETLLSTAPNDPLVMMLARGPAGYRFTIKALQHAIPNVKIERGDVVADPSTPQAQQVDPASLRAERPTTVTTKVWMSGTLRDTREAINSLVSITLRLTVAGAVEIASAEVDPVDLEKIRKARVSA